MTWLGAGAFLFGLTIAAAPADDTRTGGKAFADAEFVNKAASGGMHEIELGMLAKTNAANAEVRGFGERMVKDHTTLADWLKTAAKGANLTVPSKMSEKDQKEIDRFSKLKGAEFDKAYMEHMLKDHQQDVGLFEQASKEAKDAGLKAFAAKALPTLKEHLEHAKRVNANLSKGGQ